MPVKRRVQFRDGEIRKPYREWSALSMGKIRSWEAGGAGRSGTLPIVDPYI